MTRCVRIGPVKIGGGAAPALIAGPCVIESRRRCLETARRLKAWAEEEGAPLVFKASYDKANRTSHESFRGPGLAAGLAILAEVKEKFGLPILTDVHSESEAQEAARVADVLQLPAFLCRQTDLVLALGRTGKAVNVKKAQFLAPWDMRHVAAKLESTGNRRIMFTERGTCFGYNNLVVDMRSLQLMREMGWPVVFDATHSVQLPGGAGASSSGQARLAPALARAAVAAGCDAVFVETHPDPKAALSDKDTQLSLAELRRLWPVLMRIHEAAHGSLGTEKR